MSHDKIQQWTIAPNNEKKQLTAKPWRTEIQESLAQRLTCECPGESGKEQWQPWTESRSVGKGKEDKKNKIIIYSAE